MFGLRTGKRQNHNTCKENHLKPDCNETLDRLIGWKYLPFLAKNKLLTGVNELFMSINLLIIEANSIWYHGRKTGISQYSVEKRAAFFLFHSSETYNEENLCLHTDRREPTKIHYASPVFSITEVCTENIAVFKK